MPMVDAYTIGAKIVVNIDSINAALQKFTAISDAVKATNGYLTTTTSMMSGLAGSSGTFAANMAAAASAAERIKSAAAQTVFPSAPAGFGGGAGGSMSMPSGPTLAYGGGGVPATIPGNPYYSGDSGGGRQSWGWTPITGYGGGGTPPGGDGGGGAPPNWGAPNTPDEPFIPTPRPVPLYPKSTSGGVHDFLSPMFYGRMIAEAGWAAAAAPYDAAASVQQTELMLTANGLTQAQAAQAYNRAVKMQQDRHYSSLSVGDILGITQMAYLQTKDMGTTEQLLPQMAAAAVVMQGLGDSNVAAQTQYLMRSADLSGVLNTKDKNGNIDPARSLKFMQDFISVEMATGDALDPNQFLHFYQNAGPAIFGLSDKGREAAMLVAYSLGQQKAGTGLTQLTKELIGGKMSIGNEKYLESIGILDPTKVLPGSAHGGYVQMKAGAVKDEALLISDPQAWIAQQIGQAYGTETPAQFQDLIHKTYAAAGSAQAARFIGESIFQNPMIQRQLAGAAQVPALSDLALQFNQTPTGAAASAKSASNAILVTLGTDIMPLLKTALQSYTAIVNAANNAATKHPQAAMAVVADAAAAATWAAVKITSKVAWPSTIFGKSAGLVADSFRTVAEPVLVFQALMALDKVLGKFDGTASLPRPFTTGVQDYNDKIRDAASGPGSSPSNPAYTHIVNMPQPWNNGLMPSAPNNFNPSVAPPMPGQSTGGHQ